MLNLELKKGKKIYFASDFHLGAPDFKSSLERELKIIHWLNEIKADAQAIFLVGDIFDFWYEYKNLVPKGFIRFLGKLAEITDAGVELYIFGGNHDMWQLEYFQEQFGAIYFRKPLEIMINEKKFFVAHGDGLAKNDMGYGVLKSGLESPMLQFLFRHILPAQIGTKIGLFWGLHSWKKKKESTNIKPQDFDNDIIEFARTQLITKNYDYFIFGHYHFKNEVKLNQKTIYFNLGDWIVYNSYLVFDGLNCTLMTVK